jgi:hypothetical protein
LPYLRPGVVSYHTATKQVQHDYPCIEDGVAGVAVKQKEQSWTLGIANRNIVLVGEDFAIIHKGQVQVPTSLLTASKGDPVYITVADNTLSTSSGGGKVPFGRVMAVAGGREGTPTGFLRIDMDARDAV